MNKVWLLVGVVLLGVLLLGAWLFLVNFGGFSLFLGEKSQDALKDLRVQFLGSWEAEGYETMTFFSSQTYQRAMDEGRWNLTNGSLCLYQFGQVAPDVRYQYEFSSDGRILTLTDDETSISVVYTKLLSE